MSEKERKECAQWKLSAPSLLSLNISSHFLTLVGNNHVAHRLAETVIYHNLDIRRLEASSGFTVKKLGLKFQLFH